MKTRLGSRVSLGQCRAAPETRPWMYVVTLNMEKRGYAVI